jgi:hypothetical protein
LSFLATENNLATFNFLYYVIMHFPEEREPTELISVSGFFHDREFSFYHATE